MDTYHEVVSILQDALRLNTAVSRDFRLIGALPELDSIAVTAILAALEDRYDFIIADDEIDSSHFHTVGTLVDFVDAKLRP